MKLPSFEIKIAFCGYVNSGKSTLVNALLQQKYSEVSMDRTTLGVNSFRVFSSKKTIAKDVEDFDSISSDSSKEREEENGTTWSVVPENLQTATETYQVISKVNSALRGTSKIEESTFDIEVPETICDMRDDTQLVVVDLPGFTFEEGDAYKSYLSSNWATFDCVVVVLDITQSASKQLELVNFVKDNLTEIKEIPVVFACNKVDSSYDPELNMKLDELESAANCVFVQNGLNFSFVTVCAKDAFIYRASSGVSFTQFESLDLEWIEKIGVDEVSRSKWRQLSPREKYEVAYKVVCNETVIAESLANTKFPKFLMAVKEAVEGSDVQLKLIQKQLAVALKAVQTFDETTVTTISKIKCICERLGIATDMTFNDHFWATFKNYMTGATETYKLNTDHKVFHVAMSQLIAYYAELGQAAENDVERCKVMDEMVALVRVQLTELLKYAESWQERYIANKGTVDSIAFFNGTGWYRIYNGDMSSDGSANEPHGNFAHYWIREGIESWKNKYTEEISNTKFNPVTKQEDWFDLSMRDFEIAFASILLALSSKALCLHFGSEKMRMDSLMRKFDSLHEMYSLSCSNSTQFRSMFQSIAGKYDDNGDFVPDDPNKYDVFVHFKMSKQISDPEHWGHLAWKFCEFMEKTSN